jgi:hypothetical protein
VVREGEANALYERLWAGPHHSPARIDGSAKRAMQQRGALASSRLPLTETVMLIRLLCTVLTLLPLAAFAQHGGGSAADRAPPPEARQFDFMVGEWTLDVKPKVGGLAATLHGVPKLTGTWKARRAFDGFGVDDDLRIVDASGNPVSLGRALRIWSTAEKRWLVTALDVYRARFTASTGHWDGSAMTQNGSGIDRENNRYLTRTRFHDIGADRFVMTQDRSYDAGTTWDEGALVIEATRAATGANR